MDLIAVLAISGCLLLGLLKALAIKEAQEWIPILARFIVKRVVRRLPLHARDRYREEWLADLEEFPGSLSKLLRAFGCVYGSFALQSRLAGQLPIFEEAVGSKEKSNGANAADLERAVTTLNELIELAGNSELRESAQFLAMAKLHLLIDLNEITNSDFRKLCESLEGRKKSKAQGNDRRRIRNRPRRNHRPPR